MQSWGNLLFTYTTSQGPHLFQTGASSIHWQGIVFFMPCQVKNGRLNDVASDIIHCPLPFGIHQFVTRLFLNSCHFIQEPCYKCTMRNVWHLILTSQLLSVLILRRDRTLFGSFRAYTSVEQILRTTVWNCLTSGSKLCMCTRLFYNYNTGHGGNL